MDLVKILENKNNVYHLQGVDDSSISSAEETLGVKFAEDYRNYLRQYALLSYGVHELTGICKSERLNVINATLRERADNDKISDNMYLLEYVGVENLTIWQNTKGEVFEVYYMQYPHKIFDSLAEYIQET